MVDCGFGLKETIRRLAELDVQPQQIDAILVTHEHQDHISGVESLAAKFDLRVYMTEGTARVWKSRGRVTPEIIRSGKDFLIGDVQVQPVAVPHDAREPVQFILSYSDQKVGILTDLGSLTRHIYDAYKSCQTLLVEANHDLVMLQNGSYPASLKRRVSGNWGHLNNMQTADFLAKIFSHGLLKKVIIGHISEQNNQVELVRSAFEVNSIPIAEVTFASQGEPLAWLNLG